MSPIDAWQALIETQPSGVTASMSYPSGTAMDQLHYSPTCNGVDINNFDDYSSSYTPDESDLTDLSPGTSLESLDSESSDHSYAQKPGPTPRRPFQSSYDRQQTAQTRKNTACLRCRMQRVRVGTLCRCPFLAKFTSSAVLFRSHRPRRCVLDLQKGHKAKDEQASLSSL